MSDHLFPFALFPAFPDALVGRYFHDYYGNSVTLGLAPFRRSHVRPCCTSERDLGAPLISLNIFTRYRSILRRLRRLTQDDDAGDGTGFMRLSGGRRAFAAGN